MLYFKTSEIIEKYHVSAKTVANWVRDAKDGKLDLKLRIEGNKAWIANTPNNIALIKELIAKRKKFRNTLSLKEVSPTPEFYNLYNPRQIFDITNSLDIYREIPFQYGYFDGGAELWDKYVQKLASETSVNALNATVKLLEVNRGYIDEVISNYKRVNVIDIGAGNGLPVKEFLAHIKSQGKLGRYIAVDISSSMIDIARQNIANWFDNSISFEGYEADITHDRFSDPLVKEVIGKAAKDTINIVLVLGGTLSNLRSPDNAMQTIHDSMNRQDIMIYTRKLDSETTRQYFDFGISEKMPSIDPKTAMILDLMNIDESLYDVEMGFDSFQSERYIRVRLKTALNLKFSFAEGDRIVSIDRGESILLWRSWHQSATEIVQQLGRNGFTAFHASQSMSKDYILAISSIAHQ